MPLVGESVRAAQVIRSTRDIDRVLGRAGALAKAAGDSSLAARSSLPFTHEAVSAPTLDRFLATMRERVVWVNEWNCFNRAQVGAHTLNSMTGTGLQPADDAFTAVIAIQEFGPQADDAFHAAVAVRPRGSHAPLVFDPLPPQQNLQLQTLDEWAGDNPTRLLRPWSGTGIGGRSTFVNDEYFAFAAEQLKSTWANAAKHGVQLL